MKRSVLLTNYQMTGFSGSELDTLNIANYFLSKDYDVTIFTFRYGYPLLGEIDERIKIVTSMNIGDMKKKYNIIWAHHFPLLDYLLFFQGISADYIHYVSLSSFTDYECLPEYYNELNLNSILSYEGKMVLKDENYDISNINIFTNYSPRECFDYKIKNHKLKKICIVSNHVPEELLQFVSYFNKTNKNSKIDIYGRGFNYTKVTPNILYKYDLVISIARTIYDALALGIPAYCYDRFGGDGYITTNNISDSYNFNFSGRFSHKKMNYIDLYNDITDNYSKSLKELTKLRKFAYENFCFEKMMDRTIRKLKKTKKFNIDKVIMKYPHLVRKAPLFYNRLNDEITKLNKYKKNDYKAQIYFDYGFGFNEKNSIKKYYKINNDMHYIDIRIPRNVINIRFDFTDLKYTKINDISINEKKYKSLRFLNCVRIEDGSYISINNDPGFIFKNNGYTRLKINFHLEILSYEELLTHICCSNKLYRKLKKRNNILNFISAGKE